MAQVCRAPSWTSTGLLSNKEARPPTRARLSLVPRWRQGGKLRQAQKPMPPLRNRLRVTAGAWNPFQAREVGPPPGASYEPSAPPYYPDPEEVRERENVAQKLRSTAAVFRRWGTIGFWTQLICSLVAATILAFSVIVTGRATNPATFYLTATGVALAFISTFWSWGYNRLAHRLQASAEDPSKAPSRTSVVRNLTNGIIINMVGLAATLLGAQATTGLLVAKALTSAQTPYMVGTPQGQAPVLALDVFLIQASFNVVLSHFFGLIFELLLLRKVTQSPPPPATVIPKPA